MTWTALRWVWRLETPLFVGMSPAGALNRCRLYVPARAIWGALTAELARSGAFPSQGDSPPPSVNEFPNYEEVGKHLCEKARFTYLYPAEQTKDQWLAWLPRYEPQKGLLWRREGPSDDKEDLPHREMRLRLLSTRPSTAIDPESDAAEEGSLRETECLNTRWRNANGRDAGPVGLVGYVFVNGDPHLANCLRKVDMLFVGGDTRYGLGRIKQKGLWQPVNDIFGYAVTCDTSDPLVHSPIALAHARGDCFSCGELEALRGWDMGNARRLEEESGPYWVPGSKKANEKVNKDAQVGFNILPSGIWHADTAQRSR